MECGTGNLSHALESPHLPTPRHILWHEGNHFGEGVRNELGSDFTETTDLLWCVLVSLRKEKLSGYIYAMHF